LIAKARFNLLTGRIYTHCVVMQMKWACTRNCVLWHAWFACKPDICYNYYW